MGSQFQWGFLLQLPGESAPTRSTSPMTVPAAVSLGSTPYPSTSYRPNGHPGVGPEDELPGGRVIRRSVCHSEGEAPIPLGTMYAEGVIDPEDVPVEGGWVTVPMTFLLRAAVYQLYGSWSPAARMPIIPFPTTFYATRNGGSGLHQREHLLLQRGRPTAGPVIADAVPFELYSTNHLSGREVYPCM